MGGGGPELGARGPRVAVLPSGIRLPRGAHLALPRRVYYVSTSRAEQSRAANLNLCLLLSFLFLAFLFIYLFSSVFLERSLRLERGPARRFAFAYVGPGSLGYLWGARLYTVWWGHVAWSHMAARVCVLVLRLNL